MVTGTKTSWTALLALLLCSVPGIGAGAFTGEWQRQADVDARPVGPGPRGWTDMTYDRHRDRIILFAGSGGTYLNDLWSYDTGRDAWQQVEPVAECDKSAKTPPTQRDEHTLEYDAYNDLYWTYGGSGFGCSGASSSAQAGTTTTRIVDATLTATQNDHYRGWTVSANNRTAYVEHYDAAARTLHLATPIANLGSGTSYRLYAQRGGGTYYYSPATREWRGFEAPYWGYGGPVPINRLSPALAYSDSDQALVMFAGKGYNDTWAMDVRTKTWVQMNGMYSTSAPPARTQVQHAMVYDRAHERFVLFGGRCTELARCTYHGELDDTWVYDLKTNTWTQMHPPVRPPARQQHNLVYDPHHRVAVLYGGRSGSTALNDVWVYDLAANTWTRVTTATAPPARSLTAMAYDEGERRFVLYGGNANQRDVWQLRLIGGSEGNSPPTAVIDVSPTSGDTGTTFSFDAAASSDPEGPIASYSWDFGDGSAGSGATVSHRYSIPGSYTVRLTVTDSAGASHATTATVSVAAAVEGLVVDNRDSATSRTGTWLLSTGANPWSSDSVYSDRGSTFRWTPTVPTAGNYKVYAWWTYHANRASNVPYRIRHAAGIDTVTVNQHDARLAGRWILLGTYGFAAGDSGYVEVSSENGQASADAIRLEPTDEAPAPPTQRLLIDNRDGNTSRTGTWHLSTGASPWGADSLYNDLGATFRWTPTITASGSYRVYAWWTHHPNRSRTVPYRIRHAAGTTTVIVNQNDLTQAGRWNLLGTFQFDAGSGYVEVSSENGQASADAIKLEPADGAPPPVQEKLLIDNRDGETSRTGTWLLSTGPNAWGADSVYNDLGATFRWTPTITTPGAYRVYAWWTYHANRSRTVPYRIQHAGGISTVTVDQKDLTRAGRWNLLGTFDFDAGSGYVEVSSESGQASADAIKLEPGTAPPVAAEVIVDNTSPSTSRTGTWYVSEGTSAWASDSLYSNGGGTFRWRPELAQRATYEVYAWWTHHPNRSTRVPYRVRHAGGVSTVLVSQYDLTLTGRWVRLGSFELDPADAYVEVSSENGQACADAVRFVPVP